MLKLELKSARTTNRGRGTINHLAGRSSQFCNGELFYNEDGGLYTISKDDIVNWQTNDRFTFTRINVNGDGLFYRDLEEINDILAGTDDENDRVYYISVYDDNTHTLTTTARYDWNFNARGYIVRNNITGTSLDVVIVTPSGEQIVTNVPVAVYKDGARFRLGAWKCHGLRADGYVAWVLYEEKSKTNVTETNENDEDCTMVFEVVQHTLELVRTDGTLEPIWKYTVNPAISQLEVDSISHFSLIHIVETNFYAGYQKVWICDPADKIVKEVPVPQLTEGVVNSDGALVFDQPEGEYTRKDLTYIANDDRTLAIVYDFITCEDGKRRRSPKFLATLDGTRISGNYSNMFTKDDEIFLVVTADDKWGYIDKTGKPLAFFDDAGEFEGEYAPVIKNGMAYLINRQMERVSDCVAADLVLTICDGLYKIRSNNKQFFMTYKLE